MSAHQRARSVVDFDAPEYRADATFRVARFRFEGSTEAGFRVLRDGADWLALGPGYRLLRTVSCGVCSTDLDRQFLPFRLPQVIGHELVAVDEDGARFVVEINASPQARGLASECPDCAEGLARHCPRRLVLGIHDLPGGFGGWILAPVRAALRVPDAVSTDAALLVEPLAAALRAVDRIAPRTGDRVAVLGPRKLGMLVLAALAAHRRRAGVAFAIEALLRRADLVGLARRVGADTVQVFEGDGRDLPAELADVVVDTTASPEGFELALRIARREVHLKSTHGQAAGGLRQATALVVDELGIERFETGALGGVAGRVDVAWLSRSAAPRGDPRLRVSVGPDATGLRAGFPPRPGGCIGGAHVAVVDDLAGADAAIRPDSADEVSLVRPTGTILLVRAEGGPLADAVVGRGVKLSSSRCGDFERALAFLVDDAELRASVTSLITHRFGVEEIARAFEVARSRACVKAIVEQPSRADSSISTA